MPKLTILITEKTERVSDSQNLSGYEIRMGLNLDGQKDSPLNFLAPLIYKAINIALALFYGKPCAEYKGSPDDKSFSLDKTMADELIKLDNFPVELELSPEESKTTNT